MQQLITNDILQSLTFGQFLRMKREALGMSMVAAADKAGVYYNSLHKYESDRAMPRREALEKLKKVLCITDAELENFNLNPLGKDKSYEQGSLSLPKTRTPFANVLESLNKALNAMKNQDENISSFESLIRTKAITVLEHAKTNIEPLILMDAAFLNDK